MEHTGMNKVKPLKLTFALIQCKCMEKKKKMKENVTILTLWFTKIALMIFKNLSHNKQSATLLKAIVNVVNEIISVYSENYLN